MSRPPKSARRARTERVGRAAAAPRGGRTSPAPRGGRSRPVADADAPTQKLQKVLAQSGLGSRRDMETLITNGRVTVNGEVATIGARVGPADQIKVAGRVVRAQSTSRLPRVLLYHKPEGEIA
ncbi:MAG TPA: S4 domain-containing protein, partial [Burkholderiales bacterium]|nr:S4 domain-containing protein [Burkholderiales bacterium]